MTDNIKTSNRHIVVLGDFVNGFEFVGPFEDNEIAFAWAEDNIVDVYSIVKLEEPILEE